MPEPAHKRQLTSTVYATPLMTPTTDLGLYIRLTMFELCETGDWDFFRARNRSETRLEIEQTTSSLARGLVTVSSKHEAAPFHTGHQNPYRVAT